MRSLALTICLFLGGTVFGAAVPAAGQNSAQKGAENFPGDTTLRGRLVEVEGNKPAVETRGDKVMLAGRNQYVFNTLKDKRLAGREVSLAGRKIAGGFFQVDEIHTIHNGKLYWIRYYCEVCNISALEPGNCVCCQQPTELQEIPVGVGPSQAPPGVITTPPE